MNQDILILIRKSADKRILYLPHALNQMNRPDRLIEPSEVRDVIYKGKIIEDYHEDTRGHSCLMLGNGKDDRPIHVVCSPKEDFLAIITAYIPDKNKWTDNFQRRILR